METKVEIMERVEGGKSMLLMYYLCEKYYKPIQYMKCTLC